MDSDNEFWQTRQHEQLLQLLSTMLIEIEALRNDPGLRESQTERLARLEQINRQALHIVRAAHLSLPEVESGTLAETLSRLIDTTAEELGLSSRVSFTGVDEQGKPEGGAHLTSQAEHLLFLLAQEALFQVREHLHARRLRLTLAYGLDEVRLVLEDDGIPVANIVSEEREVASGNILPFAQDTHENAAFSDQVYEALRARFSALGGSLIREIVPEGTRVEARVPYQPPTLESVTSGNELQPFQDQVVPLQRTSVLIVDGQPVVRAGLHRLLDAYPDLLLIGEASDGVHAVSETLELGPQVVLLDAQLPAGQSLEALRQIKQLNLNTRVLLLSTEEREDYLYETLRAGADGYLLKDVTPDDLAEAIRVVARGEMLVQPQLAGRILARVGRERERGARGEKLTARELEVLRLLSRGLRNKEIAAHLFVSERTVNFHLANIYQKLNVSGRTEALSKALAQGLLER